MESVQRPPRSARPPQILRVGVLLRGRLVEERLLRDHAPVTLGQSARNTLVVPDDALPREHVLFEPSGGGYRLALGAGMDGRLGAGAGVTSLRDARAGGDPRSDGTCTVPLPDGARGKLTCGEVTVLFQLVPRPAPRPAPRLPRSIRGGLGAQVDRTLAGVLSGSLAVHVAFFAYLGYFVDTSRPPSFEDEFAHLPVRSIPVHLKKPEVKQQSPGAPAAAAPGVAAGRVRRPPPAPPRHQLTDAERRDEAHRIASRIGILQIVTTRGPGGPGLLADGLKNGSAQRDLDAALRRVRGVGTAGDGLPGLASRERARGGEVTAIADLGRGVAPVRESGGATGERRERRVSVRLHPVRDTDTDLPDLEGVNQTLRRGYAGIKACYDRGLKHDRTLGGKLAVRIVVTGAGTVTTVAVRQTTLPDAGVVACMTSTIRGWRFPPAGGRGAAAVEPTWVFKAGE